MTTQTAGFPSLYPARLHPLYSGIDKGVLLWRYLDTFKFEDIIKTSSLYFSRADTLSNYDRKEGSLTKRMEHFFDRDLFSTKFIKDMQRNGVTAFGIKTKVQGRGPLTVRNELRARAREHYKFILSRTYINCWHKNLYENDLMWRSYIESATEGVAIRSSFSMLLDAIKPSTHEVLAFPIEYINRDAAPLTPGCLPGGMSQIVADMLSKKRLEFSSDLEVRFITDSLTVDEKWADNLVGSHIDASLENPTKFMRVEIDLDKMVEAIVLHPRSDLKYKNKILDMIRASCIDPDRLIQKITISSLA